MLEDRQEDRDDDAGDEDRGDQSPVADVLVGHVEAGEDRLEEAERAEEEEDLHRDEVVDAGGGSGRRRGGG